MKIIKQFLYILAISNCVDSMYPTKRWVEICRSSNSTRWHQNKTIVSIDK